LGLILSNCRGKSLQLRDIKQIHEKHNPSEKDPKGKAAENKEFADKRQPKSPLIRQEAIF
jgi:hypothetical protein